MNSKNNWPTKKLGEILVGIIFIIFAVILFFKEQYGYSVLLVVLLIILLKLDKLTDFALSFQNGFSAKFGPDRAEKKEIPTNKLPLPGKKEDGRKYTNNLPNNLITPKDSGDIALVECKVAPSLPGTVTFNFLKDWKVWFWIANHEPKKYKAYVKIKFISDGLEKELTDGYYGGTQAWKLDAFSGIQAPGLGIPEEIKVAVREGKRVKIQINCEVKDENDNLIENKFPQTYVYDPENNSWFLEP